MLTCNLLAALLAFCLLGILVGLARDRKANRLEALTAAAWKAARPGEEAELAKLAHDLDGLSLGGIDWIEQDAHSPRAYHFTYASGAVVAVSLDFGLLRMVEAGAPFWAPHRRHESH